MKRKTRFIIAAIIASLFISIPAEAANYAISNKNITINKGDSFKLSVTNGEEEANAVWRSLNENVVIVDQDGEVTGKAIGSTKVRARYGFFYYTSNVKVVNPTIKLNKAAATIYYGGTSTNTVQLKATVKGAAKTVTWTSSDEAVATVVNGKVTSAGAGTAVITAEANGKTADCIITVKETSISLDADSVTIGNKGKGNNWKVIATVIGSKKNIKWASSDKTVATVSGGKITGKKPGTVVITAEANGVKAACTVTVNTGISIDKEYATIYYGGTSTNTVKLNTNAAKGVVLTWTSSNPEVAIVENGKVTSTGAGTAVITVTDGETEHSCIITVKESSITLNETDIQLRTKGTDKTFKLNAEIIGSKKNIKWASSDKTVATVSGGKVTAKKAGTTTITATANGMTAECFVTVSVYEPTITVNKAEYLLYTGKKGNSVKLTAKVDGPSKTVTWTSSDETVATVVNGKVTSIGVGTAIISAEANGKTADCMITVKESKVELNETRLKLDKKEKIQITADITGQSQTVTWKTSNKNIATVNSKGLITAKKNGTVTITATANGIVSSCEVVVDHKEEIGTVKKEATCLEDGLMYYTCSGCGEFIREEIIPATGHSWEETETVLPGCDYEYIESNYGYTLYTCTGCNATEERDILPATVHNFEFIEKVDAGCEEDGYILYGCTYEYCCEELEETLPATGHNWDDGTVVEPKCGDEPLEENKGYTIYNCENCESTKIENETEALVHEWEEVEVLTEVSCGIEGILLKECINCEEQREFTVDAYEHDYSIEVEVISEADCYEAGSILKECVHCHDQQEFEIPKRKHILSNEMTLSNEITCVAGAREGYKCIYDDCNAMRVVNTYPALGHDWSEEIYTIEPTCTTYGYSYKECQRCGQKEQIGDWVAMTDHNWEYTHTEGKYCHEDIWEYYDCAECDATKTEKVRSGNPMTTTDAATGELLTSMAYAHHIDTATRISEYVYAEDEDPCHDKGLVHENWTCLDCGYVHDEYREPENIRGHYYGEYEITKQPTALNYTGNSPYEPGVNYDFGTAIMVCPDCGEQLMTDKEFSVVLIDLGNGETDTIIGWFEHEEAYKNYELVRDYRISQGLETLKINDFDIVDDYYWNATLGSYCKNIQSSNDTDWYNRYNTVYDFFYTELYAPENFEILPYDLYQYSCVRAAEIAYRSKVQKISGVELHMRPNGDAYGYGENAIVGHGESDELNAQGAFDAWYNSAGHLLTMEANYTNMTAAKFCVITPCYSSQEPEGTVYWVQNFYTESTHGPYNEKQRYYKAYGAEKFNEKYGSVDNTVSDGDAE